MEGQLDDGLLTNVRGIEHEVRGGRRQKEQGSAGAAAPFAEHREEHAEVGQAEGAVEQVVRAAAPVGDERLPDQDHDQRDQEEGVFPRRLVVRLGQAASQEVRDDVPSSHDRLPSA
jgi:hypothetical protein